jgi:tol-pal system protein YbgF
MDKYILYGCCFYIVACVGCAAQSSGITTVKDDTVKLKAQMGVLLRDSAAASQVDSLRSHLRRLEDLIRDQNDLMWSMRADLNSRVSGVDNRIQALDAKIMEGDRQFSTLTRKIEGVQAQLEAVAVPDTTMSRPTDPEELYNTALTDFQRGNYELAISQFMQYLQYFPDSQLAQNAQYWIGECHYTQEKYTQALGAYEELVRRYPKGRQLPAALLRIGFTHLALNDTESGRTYLDRVILEYPKSEEATLARLRIETLPGR